MSWDNLMENRLKLCVGVFYEKINDAEEVEGKDSKEVESKDSGKVDNENDPLYPCLKFDFRKISFPALEGESDSQRPEGKGNQQRPEGKGNQQRPEVKD